MCINFIDRYMKCCLGCKLWICIYKYIIFIYYVYGGFDDVYYIYYVLCEMLKVLVCWILVIFFIVNKYYMFVDVFFKEFFDGI